MILYLCTIMMSMSGIFQVAYNMPWIGWYYMRFVNMMIYIKNKQIIMFTLYCLRRYHTDI